jgi:Uma2 family endonuclease
MAMSVGDEQPRRAESGSVTIGRFRYLRAPTPLNFPEFEEVGESKLHFELCALLYQLLTLAFAEHSSIGCDQFVYWDAKDPRACLAPDAFVRLGQPDENFRSWKVWERGAPQLAVEIISHSDERDVDWEAKLEKYSRLGVQELVRFEPEAQPPSLRVWDRLENDLVERELTTPCAASTVLAGYWRLVDDAKLGATLRLSHDAAGEQLYPTPAEARRLEAEAQRLEAEARIRELEAELAQRQG